MRHSKLEQAARQALDALERASAIMDSSAQQRQDDAITALREALAEPDIEEMTLTQIAARHEQAEQEPIYHIGIKHDAQLVDTFLRCPMTGNQLYFTSDPIQKKGMNYMRLQDGEGNDWTLIARLDEGWDGK